MHKNKSLITKNRNYIYIYMLYKSQKTYCVFDKGVFCLFWLEE